MSEVRDLPADEDLPVGGDYTVILTFTDAPRAAVEHLIDDVRNSGDFPAASAELVVDDESADAKWHY